MDKLTREQYEELWGNLEESFNAIRPGVAEQAVTDALNNVLVEACVEKLEGRAGTTVIIDALEKCGVDVTKWKGGKSMD